MEDVKVPLYYVVGHSITEEQVLLAQRAFAFTPISHAVITDVHDAELALKFTPFVRKVTPENAEKAAKEANGPVVLIGNAEFVEAVYADGTSESLKW